MNRFPQERFTKSLSSGLFIFALCVAGYSSSGSIAQAKPLDDPTAVQKSSEGKSLEIPGSFKELPGVKDAVTAKHIHVINFACWWFPFTRMKSAFEKSCRKRKGFSD